MFLQNNSFITDAVDNQPITRIDALDELFVLPLREYFYTHGCRVSVNSNVTENVTYQFIVGDLTYVKAILAKGLAVGKRICILVWGDDCDIVDFDKKFNGKIVFINTQQMSLSLIHSIMIFYFSSRARSIDFRTNNTKALLKNIQEKYPTQPKSGFLSLQQRNREADTIRVDKTVQDVFPKQPVKKQKKYSQAITNIIFLLCCTVLILIFPFLLYWGNIGVEFGSLWQIKSCIKAQNESCVRLATSVLKISNAQFQWLSPVVSQYLLFVDKEPLVKDYERLASILNVGVRLLDKTNNIKKLLPVFSTVFTMKKDVPTASSVAVSVEAIKEILPGIRSDVDFIGTQLDQLLLSSVCPFSLHFVRAKLLLGKKLVYTMHDILVTGERLTQLFPLIGGFKSPHTLLMLFQNNSELRPAGGFVGSLGLVSVEEGKLTSFTVDDVYTTDGQLKGHVDPPEVISSLLHQEHWYLRDSNWYPDFKESGEMARWFYEKETGKRVDGVVGITASFVIRLLKIVGPIDLPLYNDRITAENFFVKSNYYTQKDFFPGSTQKKDFLGALTEELIKVLEKQGPMASVSILEALSSSFRSHDVQWYENTPQIQTALEQFGWAGRVPAKTSCLISDPSVPCIYVFVSLNEANVGMNKVNPMIRRNQERTITIRDDGSIQTTITRHINNVSVEEPGGGAYRFYLRFMYPPGGVLTKNTYNNTEFSLVPKSRNQSPLPYGVVENNEGAGVLGVAGITQPGESTHLSFTMSTPTRVDMTKPVSTVVFYEQKQAGVDSLPITTTVVPPSGWEAVLIANPGQLKYNSSLTGDEEITIVLKKLL